MQVIYFPPRKSYNFLKKVTIHSQFVNIFLVIMLSLHNLFFCQINHCAKIERELSYNILKISNAAIAII